MDTEIGHYGRTYNGTILKYVNVVDINKNETRREVINNRIANIISEEIVKSSKNIIDLIEVGHLVNGYIVDLISTKINNYIICNSYNFDDSCIKIKNNEIKTILTHEQIKANQYEIKGE